jgi:hypothetical protein
MQKRKLVGPVVSYITAANAQDIEAVAASFSEGAVVRDEGRDRQGIAAIRRWAAEVSKKYRPTVETLDVALADGKTILTGRVSGNFPGSPVDLRYVFTLDGERIERLEIS